MKKNKLPDSTKQVLAVMCKMLPKVPDIILDQEKNEMHYKTEFVNGHTALVLIDHKVELYKSYKEGGFEGVQKYFDLIWMISDKFHGKNKLIA